MHSEAKSIFLCFTLFSLISSAAVSQVVLSGKVTNELNQSLEMVNVTIPGTRFGTATDQQGVFKLDIPEKEEVTVMFSSLGYSRKEIKVRPSDNKDSKNIFVEVTLFRNIEALEGITIKADRDPGSNLVRINPKILEFLPSASGSFESILRHMPGVVSNNELSSQYSVRGGNFDENLVYVNDIEIYRPLLIRSGQQEGLSFVNPDMVSSVLFSAGGFDARYGDKMSSVLDIRYKKPTFFAGSVSGSLLGGSLHLEGSSGNRRLTYLTGLRYKSNQYLLNSLETKGEYNPKFTDFQTYLTYDLSPEWEISFLGNFASNRYQFSPIDQYTSFGTVNEALQLKIYFDGQEVDQFNTLLGALTTTYHPNDQLELKWILSGFQTREKETYDIMGQYLLNELDKRMNESTFGDSLLNIGIGTFLDHARNWLYANVASIDHKGSWTKDNTRMQWGLKLQTSNISDVIEEWMMIDSSGYSIPYTDSVVTISETYFADAELALRQASAYYRLNYEWDMNRGTAIWSGGIRANYTDINDEFILSPRTSFSFLPVWEKDLQFRLSAGAYHQPPFFKEFRDLNGNMQPGVLAQKSVHLVGGADYYFMAWARPFKFSTELYYKYLWDLVPYEIDNVRIRYYGDNLAVGYATGLDLKVNGEFVPGIESWASLSIMKTQEDILGDSLGFLARPTDQRVNVALFFQDFLPNNDTYKAHLNLLFGTGLPYGPPGSQQFKASLRIPPYRRVDLGFSKNILGNSLQSKLPGLNMIKAVWISIEIFNLLDIDNTISHIWIRDVSNRQFAVPNYLTGRRFNIKLLANF